MKNSVAVVALAVCMAFLLASLPTEAMPSIVAYEHPDVDVFPVQPQDYVDIYTPERADRHRRVTCDLLSVNTAFGSLNHAACAAHCLAMGRGYRGGRCRDGVCHCRR